MTKELYELLIKLDNMDFNTKDYFSWDEPTKNNLTENLLSILIPVTQLGLHQRWNLIYGLDQLIYDAECEEEYEQAEIWSRCLIRIEEIVSV
jgi:hypothetical protein